MDVSTVRCLWQQLFTRFLLLDDPDRSLFSSIFRLLQDAHSQQGLWNAAEVLGQRQMIWYPRRRVFSASVGVHMSTRTAFMIGNDICSYELMQGRSWTSWICVKDMLSSGSRRLRYLSKKENLQSMSRENGHCSDITPAECNQRF